MKEGIFYLIQADGSKVLFYDSASTLDKVLQFVTIYNKNRSSSNCFVGVQYNDELIPVGSQIVALV